MKAQSDDQKSFEGTCRACQETINKRQIKTHFKKCSKFKRSEGLNQVRLLITDTYFKNFWLVVEVSPKATFKKLDQLLREVWVECCGHLSNFGGYSDEISKSKKIVEVLKEDDEIPYLYDFGTTTELKIKSLGTGDILLPKSKDLMVIGRNYYPPSPCGFCGNQASLICFMCWTGGGDTPPLCCQSCVSKHAEACEEGDEMLACLPNSPRAGECGYDAESFPEELFPKKW